MCSAIRDDVKVIAIMQEGIFDEFSKAVVEKVKKFQLGGGLDPNTTLGPLISQAAVERVGSLYWL